MLRFILACAIVTSIGLAGCSGGSSSVPAGAPVAASMSHTGWQLVHSPVEPLACASKFLLCVKLSNTRATKFELCVSTTGNCSSGSFPTETWSGRIVTLKGKKFTGISKSFKPNPGNPTEVTLRAKVHLPDSHGHVDFILNVKACNSASGCHTGKVGIETV